MTTNKNITAKKLTIENFLDDLASSKSAPGGGSTACLQGAFGAGLIAMVCALTKKCEPNSQYYELNESTFEKALSIKEKFCALIDEDIAEVQDYFRNISTLPNKTDEEKAYKNSELQAAYKRLATPPTKCIDLCVEATQLLVKLYGKSFYYAQSDLACAAYNFLSSSECAWINIVVNYKYIKDAEYVDINSENLSNKIEYIKKECLKICHIEQNLLR